MRYVRVYMHMLACVHSHICILMFASKLMETFVCMRRIFLHVHWRAHTMCVLCTCMYCMHVRVRKFLETFAPNLVEDSTGHRTLHAMMGYLHFTFMLAYADDGLTPKLLRT
jgi:hypothetical protein